MAAIISPTCSKIKVPKSIIININKLVNDIQSKLHNVHKILENKHLILRCLTLGGEMKIDVIGM